jgi:hypothetical protein
MIEQVAVRLDFIREISGSNSGQITVFRDSCISSSPWMNGTIQQKYYMSIIYLYLFTYHATKRILILLNDWD